MPKKRTFIGLLSIMALLYIAALAYLVIPMLRHDHRQRGLRIDTVKSRFSEKENSVILDIEGDGFNSMTQVALVQDLGNHRAVVASFNTLGPISDMAFSGDTAYLANLNKGLQAVDFSNPLHPVLQISSWRPLAPQKVTLGKQRLWLALGRDGVMALPFDSDPFATMEKLTDLDKSFLMSLPGPALDLALFDDHTACVALAGKGLAFVTIDSNNEQKVLSTLPLPGHATSLARSGRIIYVASFQKGLQVVDASDLSRPRLLKTLDDFGGLGDIAISGNAAYITGQGNFAILDISSPQTPTALGSIDYMETGSSARIDLGESEAYLSSQSGILVVDTEEPENPFISDWVDMPHPKKVIARGDHLLVAQGQNGIRIIDRKRLRKAPPDIFGSRTKARDLLTYKGLAFLASGEQGLEIVDLASEPPRSLTVVPLPGDSCSVARHEQTLYVASIDQGVQILDISKPEQPRAIGAIRGCDSAYRVRISQGRAFALSTTRRRPLSPGGRGGATSKLQIYDLAVPHTPVLLGEKELGYKAVNMTITGNRVYLACNQEGMVIIDARDPRSPREVATAALPWPQQGFAHSRDIAVRDGFAYVANGSEGVQVYDVVNPQQPNLVASLKTPGFANVLALSGNSLYVSDNAKSLLRIDVSEPARSRIAGSSDLALNPRKMAVSGEAVYLVSSMIPLIKAPLPVPAGRLKTRGSTRLSATFACSDIPRDAVLQLVNGPEMASYPAEPGCPQERMH